MQWSAPTLTLSVTLWLSTQLLTSAVELPTWQSPLKLSVVAGEAKEAMQIRIVVGAPPDSCRLDFLGICGNLLV